MTSWLFRSLLVITLAALTGSCTDVAFQSQSGNVGDKGCEGGNCPAGAYSWFESGFGLCSKPCGGGTQTETVECRRNSDNVTVPDSNCPPPKPVAAKNCNMQACTGTYAWNWTDYGACSKTCGGGVKTRTVVCQNQSGQTVADSNCPTPKPAVSIACNTDPCTGGDSYTWQVTAGTCSKQCGGGTATDTVVCKKNDGTTVADSFCSATTKPPTTRTCNTDPCPVTYTYTWEAGAYSACSKDCGDGVQTRSVACKRNDGQYVSISYCDANTKPAGQQACHLKDCPTGHAVTQTAYVTPAANSVDVILVVDDSSSMKEDQAKLAARMNGLLTDLDALNIDYQVCVTTTDVGYYKGSPVKWVGLNSFVMNKNSANRSKVFVDTINSLGAEWSSDEQGIKSTYYMIRDFRGSGCLRPQSTLTVIEISDEDERSVGGNKALSSVQYQPLTAENQPDNLISLVHSTFDSSGFVKPFIWNSIIVKPGDKACENYQDAQTSPSFPGVVLASLSNKTNGAIGSICDSDYSQNLKYIKDRVVNSMPGLKLQCVPIDNPVVTFDKPVSTTISRSGNELKFTPALPEGVMVTAKYTCPN